MRTCIVVVVFLHINEWLVGNLEKLLMIIYICFKVRGTVRHYSLSQRVTLTVVLECNNHSDRMGKSAIIHGKSAVLGE